VSKPSDDYMMVFWCGTNPALDYNGGFVLSRYWFLILSIQPAIELLIVFDNYRETKGRR